MREGSTSFGACKVRCWRWLFGNKTPVSLLRIEGFGFMAWGLTLKGLGSRVQGGGFGVVQVFLALGCLGFRVRVCRVMVSRVGV